ncbi:MAG: 4a-hydroxytetrahydrobiopterin dehydratase [Noviherbaspirillum sp.]
MNRLQVLNEEQLQQLPEGWQIEDDGKAIRKKFSFADFQTAWKFMNEIAVKAEQMNHHPEWSNVYGRVDIRLTTHDAGGLTMLDMEMARFVEQACKNAG